jgi:uncharacterized secreted protein with C-terminal beta-propeller domain
MGLSGENVPVKTNSTPSVHIKIAGSSIYVHPIKKGIFIGIDP